MREPSPEHFPGKWSPDADGVRAMLQHLLRYAGLDTYRVALEMTGTHDPLPLVQESGAGALHTAAWFSGGDDGTLRFGCNLAYVDQPERLAGILAHEVAHAYRHHHGLHREGAVEEESLTDLTTVFLGFGVLTTNIAGMAVGTLRATRTVGTREKGYLSALEMAYLLAAQVVARGREPRPIADKLASSPRRYFLAACRELRQHKAAMLEQLHVPLAQASTARLFNVGQEVSPVRTRPRWAAPATAGLGAALWGVSRVLPLPWWGAIAAAGAFGLGVWLYPRYRCSHPECRAPLRPDDLLCGNCGGTVSGAMDRLGGRTPPAGKR